MIRESEEKKKDRSPAYPARSLKTGVDQIKQIYSKDRNNWTTDEIAVKHMGYAGLNGNSRVILSSLKKFGLLEGKGSRVRVSDLAIRMIHPKDAAEEAEAIREAFLSPAIFQSILEEYPNWSLPSDATLKSKLIRDYKFLPEAAASLIDTLKDSLDFVTSFGGRPDHKESERAASSASQVGRTEVEFHEPKVLITEQRSSSQFAELQLPSPVATLRVATDLSSKDKERIVLWLDTVAKPWLTFLESREEESA